VFYLSSSDKHTGVVIAALLLPSDPVEWDIELALRHPTIPEAPVAVVIYDHGAVEVVKRYMLSTWQTPREVDEETWSGGWLADFISAITAYPPVDMATAEESQGSNHPLGSVHPINQPLDELTVLAIFICIYISRV
jgi:hypothetical protein